MNHFKQRPIFSILFVALCTILFNSCSVFRELSYDGPDGPDIYDYKNFDRDTIFRGDTTFVFPYRGNWNIVFGSDSQKISLDSFVHKTWGNDCQLLIIHNDSVLYDKWYEPHYPGQNATVFSVTKSLTSLLCGIAVDEGYIKSVNDPVTEYIPELAKYNSTYKKLKIVHLLNMQAGFKFDENYSLRLSNALTIYQICQLRYGKDLTKVFRHMKFSSEPGTKYEYNSAVPALLSLIIERATHQSYAHYMSEKVWKPLGMQYNAWITLDSRKHHHAHGSTGLGTNVYDLAKIGRLYLNKGIWNGHRIVSEEWIKNSLVPTTENEGYHYNWYHQYYDDKPDNGTFYALGIGRQFLYINPKKNAIIVLVTNFPEYDLWEGTLFDRLCELM